jgi:hypothetical protein
MSEPQRPLKVFLCHASQDKPAVRELYKRLNAEAWIDPWLDEERLTLGQHWTSVIEDALDVADAVIIFLSHNSVQKEGFVQRELNYAWDISLEKPRSVIFLIPFRLDNCEVPRHLRSKQWGDYFGEEKERTYQILLRSLKDRRAQKLRLEEEELAALEKEKRERNAEKKTKQEAAERIAQENAAQDKAERESAEKARLEAEEQAQKKAEKEKREREANEKASREKARREATRKPELEVATPKLVKQPTPTRASQPTHQATDAPNPPYKSGNRATLWAIGFFVALFIIGMLAFKSWNTLPPTVPTLTGTPPTEISPSATFSVVATNTLVAIPNTSITSSKNSGFGLAYISEQDSKGSLHTLSAEGVKKELISEDKFDYLDSPALSPDGDEIALATNDGIYSVNLNTGLLKKITTRGTKPVWSPDKSLMSFETGDESHTTQTIGYDCNWDYSKCITRTDYLSKQQIFHIYLGGDSPLPGSVFVAYRGAYSLAWNYDGSRYAYIRKNNVDFICLDGYPGDCTQIKDYVEKFDWSPIKNEIVYSASWKGNFDLYLLKLSDYSQTNLTNGAYNNYAPVWDHSGNKIAFVSDRDGNNEIYIMDISKLTFENLTQNASNDFSPIWSPDDSEIIFVSDRSENFDIFSIDVESGQVTNLTNDASDEFSPLMVDLNQ